eukprot:COSAG02_NODE_245_length_27293_cov_16.488012_11_plen_174_part_00
MLLVVTGRGRRPGESKNEHWKINFQISLQIFWRNHRSQIQFERERAGCGRRTSQTPRRSPTEPVPPRSPTPEHSSAPLVPAEPRSYPPYHGLPGIKPEQPNPPKETASAAGLPTPARRRSYPRASPPTQHPHQLQQSRARRAGPPRSPAAPPFPTSITPSPVAFFNIRARAQI